MLSTLRLVRGGPAAPLVLFTAVLAMGAAPPRPLSNFPVPLDGPVRQPPLVTDLDGDGRNEIVVDGADAIVVVTDDGQLAAGFPVPAGGRLAGPLAVGDLEGDGRREILAVTQAGQVIVLRADGTPVPGFPQNIGKPCRAGGALLDLDRDGSDEVVLGCNDGRVHAWRPAASAGTAPRSLSGYPARVGAEVTSSPVLADLGGEEPAWILLVGAADGGVHGFHGGRPAPGFPIRSRYIVSGAPAAGDLDGDGRAEVVFTSQDYQLYAADAGGRILPGFPLEAGYRIYGGPALVDLTGDRLPEIAFAGSDRKLYALDGQGRLLPGFPVALGDDVQRAAVAGDLDRDGRQELLVTTASGHIHAIGGDGKPLAGWPVTIEGRFATSPVLADLVGDGAVEIVVGTLEGNLLAYKSARSGEAPLRLDWPAEAHDAGRSGRLFPNPGRFLDLAVLPQDARSTHDLTAAWRYVDPDREPEGEAELRWFRGGQEVASLRGRRTVPADQTRKDEQWHFTVRAVNDGPDARTFTAPGITVRNAPPSPPEVRLAPAAPRTLDDLRVEQVRASEDPDGDTLTYRYQWFLDGRPAEGAPDAAVLAAASTLKRQVWTVVVRAWDGTDPSEPVEASTRVLNTPPSPPVIVLEAAEPTVTDDLVVRTQSPSTDPDGDALRYRYRWKVSGRDAGLAESVDTVPAGLARKTDVVEVAVYAFDGSEESAPARGQVTVRNTQPSRPTVKIRPATPATGQALLAAVETASADPDHDAVRYTFVWSVDGAPAGVEADTVPASRVQAHQKWTVAVRSHDDDGPGGAAEASVVVENTAPVPPVVTIDPPSPLPEQPLRAVVRTPASDRDGHAVSLDFVWTVDGKRALEGEEVPAGRVRKNERWTVVVTPNDGRVDGRRARATVVVGNRPPPAPGLVLEPSAPVGGQALNAKVNLAADPDDDRLQPRLRWALDGEPVADLDDQTAVPGDRVRRDQVWAVKAFSDDGSAWSPAASATVRIADRAPTAPVVHVAPADPVTTDDLTCVVEVPAKDPDGDAATTLLRWYRGGEPTAHTGAALPASATRKGHAWSCRGTVSAGGVDRPGAVSSAVKVANSPPTTPEVRMQPERPTAGLPLRCGVARASADPDGDRVSYAWSWQLDGSPRREVTGPVVPADQVQKGQSWACSVTPSDGAARGSSASARATVGNTPPPAPRVRLVPDRAQAGQDLRCEIVEDAVDADGDRIVYQYRWYLGDEHQPFAPTSVEVRGRLVEAGTRWRCGVVAHDGTDGGEEAFSGSVHVRDAAPEQTASAK